MDVKYRFLVSLGIFVTLALVFFFITVAITKYTGYAISQMNKQGEFENCLEKQDITLYINSDNPAKTLRNTLLIEYLKNIKIMNCMRNNQFCMDRGVENFPTWIINNKKSEYDIDFNDLVENSGCKIFK